LGKRGMLVSAQVLTAVVGFSIPPEAV
jgi:hypothetical protein